MPITGATGPELRVGGALNGADLAVTVTASSPTSAPGSAVSPTVKVSALPEWRAAQIYLGGETVLHDGRVYVAQWWTQGVTPAKSGPNGAWSERGVEVATSKGVVRAWTDSWIYTGGEIVAHEGRLYKAGWWTRNQEPGASPYNGWTDLGAY
ncbi:hypothetical protein ET445_02530 [Agromyces protaetiae]|uniref:Chitin-binding type-3 domain-containing protein n=1 Tax=Agromyces protaetiae TaxID=2509455 RepID=A0A4P6FF60_9MICO|nr:carbohydrate-binding protein [Agromyces protaetiae]QAY72377.1 hypothetical protein ET445_02530 [Agromyces protaetiae]